jgi:hypothetical protein
MPHRQMQIVNVASQYLFPEFDVRISSLMLLKKIYHDEKTW